MPATETAVIVPVPKAEGAVGPLRAELDAAAVRGVPAHVTVLYPFVPPGQVGQETIDALAEAIASVRAFDVTFASTRWFDADVVWLEPEPAEPFRELTRAVYDRFPGYPPYGGAYEEVVPHLTVGNYQPVDKLEAAAESVRHKLPVRARVASAVLMQGSDEPGSWHVVAEFPLGG
jgi:2'-5' RNA ligase